jgi:hypothetical protein
MKNYVYVAISLIVAALISSCGTAIEKSGTTAGTESYSSQVITLEQVERLHGNQSYEEVVSILGSSVKQSDPAFMAFWFKQGCEQRTLFVADHAGVDASFCIEGKDPPWKSKLENAKASKEYVKILGIPNYRKTGKAYIWKDREDSMVKIVFIEDRSISIYHQIGQKFNFHTGFPPFFNRIEMDSERKFTMVPLSPPQGRLDTLLHQEVTNAKSLGQKPFLFMYSDLNPKTRSLRISLYSNDPVMMDAVKGTYVIVVNILDLPKWRESVPEGFIVEDLPVFWELDANGEPTGRNIEGDAWDSDLSANMAPVLKRFIVGVE